MALNLDTPEWLKEYIRTWAWRLRLYKVWQIDVGLALVLNDDPDVHARVTIDSNVNIATIMFRADVEDTPQWRQTAIHELLHIAHGRVDHFFDYVLFPTLPEAAQALAKGTYDGHYESYIHTLAAVRLELEPPPKEDA